MASPSNFLIPAQRQKWILEYVETHNSIQIKEASEICKVSEATIRRDLDDLAAEGLLERTHGGAILNRGTSFEQIQREKMQVYLPEKSRIAKAAVELIKEGDSIFLDSGTTAFFVAQQLANIRNLTVITNNLDIAYSVSLHPTSTLIVTGGVRRDGYSVLAGSMAEEFINGLYVDVVFVGGDAVSAKFGVYNSNFMEIGVKRSIIDCGKRRVLIVDHSKFERKALTKVCDIEKFDTLITDKEISEEVREILENKISNLIIV